MAPHFTYPTHYLDTEIVVHARPTYPTSHHCYRLASRTWNPFIRERSSGAVSRGSFRV